MRVSALFLAPAVPEDAGAHMESVGRANAGSRPISGLSQPTQVLNTAVWQGGASTP